MCKWVSKCYSITFFQPLFLSISNLLNFLMIFYTWMPVTQCGVNTLVFVYSFVAKLNVLQSVSLNIIFMHESVYIVFPLCLSTATLVCFSCSHSLSRKERDELSLCFVQSQSTKTTSVFELHVSHCLFSIPT